MRLMKFQMDFVMAARLNPTMMKSKSAVLVADAITLHEAIKTSVAESLMNILGKTETIPGF